MAATVDVQIPPVLIPVFTGEADVRGAYGGRGSGKTLTFAKMTAIRAYMWDQAGRVSIHARQYWRAMLQMMTLDAQSIQFQSTPANTGGRC